MRFTPFVLIVATFTLLTGCGMRPTAAQLNDDNPIRPNPPAPFGMEDFFSTPPRKVRVAGTPVADATEQPVPARVRLGRWLFFDERLSSDKTVSCATWNPNTHAFVDEGRAAVSHQPRDIGAFKTPGLREVAKHPPYMHDGSLATLRAVVEFYNRGGTPNAPKSGRRRSTARAMRIGGRAISRNSSASD